MSVACFLLVLRRILGLKNFQDLMGSLGAGVTAGAESVEGIFGRIGKFCP